MAKGFHETGLVYSEGYSETMQEQVKRFLKERETAVTVRGADGNPIAAFRFDAESPRGTVTVIHGFTESAEKYSEMICSLLRNGFSVVAYDQRGHGASWRDERISDISLTHVNRFENYVEDLQAVCEQILSDMPKPWTVFAHSMGGAVACAFLEDHPGIFEKAVLSAPMIAPQRGGVPLAMGEIMCVGAKLLGQTRKRIPMSRPWAGPEDFATSCATGRERFDWYDRMRVETEKYRNNGPTFGWTLEAFRVTKRLLAAGVPERVKIPVRIYTAEDDNQVIPEEQEKLAARLPLGERRVVPGSKHEIYRSPDAVLFPWWTEVLDFLRG